MTTLDFGNPVDATGGVKSQTVYVRAAWSDSWTEVPYLWCTAARWRRAPDVATADFVWTYGHGRRQFEAQFGHVFRESRPQFYVKVVFQTFAIAGAAVDRVWYGVFEAERDNIGGSVLRTVDTGSGDVSYRIDSGQQLFQAVGLEVLLQRHYLIASTWYDQHHGDGEPAVVWTNRGITFNRDGRPNRTTERKSGFYRFSAEPNTPYWSTRDIAEYLLDVHGPTSIPAEEEGETIWRIENAELLPDFDRPVIDTHGRTLREVLDQLIAPQRMRSYYVHVDESGDEDRITLNVIALNPEEISLDGGTLDPAATQVTIDGAGDPSSDAIIREISLGSVGQVVLQGARSRKVFTQSVATSDLEIRHSTSEQTAYDSPSPTSMPAAAEKRERAKRIYIARASTLASRAYLRWTLPEDWNYLSKSGDPAGDNVVVFNRPDASTGRPYRKELRFLPTLPLLSGYDYSTDPIGEATAVGGAPYREMDPIVAVAIPSESSPQRYMNLADMGRVDLEELPDGDNWDLAGVATVADDGALEIHLNAPQNSIDGGGSTDADRFDYGDIDYTDWLITIAVEDDEFCEGRYPESIDDEFARRLVIAAGEAFRYDEATYQCVVGIDADGLPVRTDGGAIRDDRPELERKARMAWEWYNTPRKVLQFATRRITGEIEIGDLVTTYGAEQRLSGASVTSTDRTINTVVAEITIECPPHEDGVPSMTLTTDGTDLDVLST